MKPRAEPATIESPSAVRNFVPTVGLRAVAPRRIPATAHRLPAPQQKLATHGLFSFLSRSEQAVFEAQCSVRRVRRRATIFSQGQKHTNYLIKEGLVRTFYVSPSGKEITLAYWSAGDLIGGPYFFDDRRENIWSAQAAEDSVVLAIDGAKLQKLVLRMPALAAFVIDSLSFKLHWVSLLLQTMGTEFIHCRLSTLLLRLAELHGEPCEDGIAIRHSFTQGDLGAMVGATRQWVSTALGQLQHDGIVRIHKRRLYILDLDRLKAQTVTA